jgi:C1A family cysteine protease
LTEVKRILNWKKAPEDSRDFKSLRHLAAPVNLPDEFELDRKIPVQDQGGIGSCFDPKTEVLTYTGWKFFKDVTLNDLVATVNPETRELIFEHPVKHIAYEYEGLMYYGKHQSLDFAVTGNHNMLVRKWNEARMTLNDHYEFVQAKDLGWYSGFMTSVVYNGFNLDEENEIKKFFTIEGLPNNKRKENRVPMVIDRSDWMQFIGIYLAEGTLVKTKKGNYIQIAAVKSREREFIKSLLDRMNIHASEYPDRFRITNGRLFNCLENHGLYKTKAPFKSAPEYMFSESSENIDKFIHGYFMGDGSEYKGRRQISTSSDKMASDLQTLMFLNGTNASIYTRGPRKSNIRGREIQGKYSEKSVIEWTSNKLSLERKTQLSSEHYVGMVYCLEMPTYHTLVTKRNEKILIAGNCTAHSSTLCFRYEVAQIKNNFDFEPSRLFQYYNTRKLQGWESEDSGGYIRDSFKAMNKWGLCKESIWPYKDTLQALVKEPSTECYEDGLKNVTVKYASVPQSETLIKQTLVSGAAISFGFNVYQSFYGSWSGTTGIMPTPKPGEELLGGHATAIIGYSNSKKAFLIQNSWSSDWGKGGLFWMPYSFALNPNEADDFWCIEEIKIDNGGDPVPPTPSTFDWKTAVNVLFKTSKELWAVKKPTLIRIGTALNVDGLDEKKSFSYNFNLIKTFLGL